MQGNAKNDRKSRGKADRPPRSGLLRCGVAVVSVAVLGFVRFLLVPLLGSTHPFVTFYAAIAISAWFGGLGSGLLAIGLGLIIGDYFFVEPLFTLFTFHWHNLTATSGNLAYTVVGLVICGTIASLRRAWSRARSASARLEAAEHRFTGVLESITDGLLVLDASSRVTYVNSAAQALMAEHGFNAAALVGSDIFDAFPEIRNGPWAKALSQARSEGRSVEVETFFAPWKRWYANRFDPMRDKGVCLCFRDITEEKYARRQLEIQYAVTAAVAHADSLEMGARAILRGVCEITGSDVATLWRFDAEANVLRPLEVCACALNHCQSFVHTTWQMTFARGVGLPGRAWASGEPVSIVDVSKDKNFPRAAVAQSDGLHAAFAAPIRLADRFYGVIEFISRHQEEPNRALLQMMSSISLQIAQFIHRKETEHTLRESEERFRLMADACPALIWLADVEGRGTWFNRAWLEFVGAQVEVEVGTGWTQHVHPDDLNRCLDSYETALKARQPWEMQYRLRRHDGIYRWMDARALPASTSSVALGVSVGCCTDVTDARLKTEELAHLVELRTAELRESTAELEDLSYSIIHDLRAPLRAMHSWSECLLDEYGTQIGAKGCDYIQRLIVSSSRMDNLVTDVLAYSAVLRTKLKLQPLDPNKLIRGILDSYPQFAPTEADIKVEGVLPTVIANEAALTQCLSHLLRNAIQFVAPGVFPHIRIGADLVPAGEGRPSSVPDHVRLWIRDNGVGIRPEHQKIVFEMFQRLEKQAEGTGIGLSIVRKAAERMGGSVGLESAPGKGSRFWIELPAASAFRLTN